MGSKSPKNSERSEHSEKVSRAIQAALHDIVLLEALSGVEDENVINTILRQYEGDRYKLGLGPKDLGQFSFLLGSGKLEIDVPKLVNHYKCLRGDYGKGPDPLPARVQRGKPGEWS